jgi:hypothetical protein
MKSALPFIGREKEIAQLRRLHARRGHVLVVGPEGVGKSALIEHLRTTLPLALCAQSETLGEIFDKLECALNSSTQPAPLVQRKNRLLKVLAETGTTVVFDGLGWTTPKISSFLESTMERAPVWICTRSEHAPDIGHFWPLLARFKRVELKPFHLSETRTLVQAAVREGLVSRDTMNAIPRLHRRAAGNPKILRALLGELARGHYDLSNARSLERLDLDRRIHELFPAPAAICHA